ncbi:MAG: Ribosome-binding factor A [Alphaproteobacteria bacterium MarineAlpha11_Bin1]|nr:MAG: Ribosome-binding factor A [Alphaproteobacteria bacterium MarineAlpha11_Bin1]|tara:strand:+ start:427 stop:852 length:426 start_codon:yes stop_codon:yes gene_type:complete
MKRGESKSRSQRQLRVGEVIRHALSQMLNLGEAHDPGLDGVSITVTEVQISPDLSNATAFVMPLGGADADPILESLNRAAPFFRRRIAAQINMRRLPTLYFQLDESFDNASHIGSLLRSPAVAVDVDGDLEDVSGASDDEP